MVILKAILTWCSWHSDWYSYNSTLDMGCVFSKILRKLFVFIMWFIFRPCQQHTILIWYRRQCRAYNYTRVWDKKKNRHQTFPWIRQVVILWDIFTFHIIPYYSVCGPTRWRERADNPFNIMQLQEVMCLIPESKSPESKSSRPVFFNSCSGTGQRQTLTGILHFPPKTEKIIGGKKTAQ